METAGDDPAPSRNADHFGDGRPTILFYVICCRRRDMASRDSDPVHRRQLGSHCCDLCGRPLCERLDIADCDSIIRAPGIQAEFTPRRAANAACPESGLQLAMPEYADKLIGPPNR